MYAVQLHPPVVHAQGMDVVHVSLCWEFLALLQGFHNDREKSLKETEEPQCHEEIFHALPVCYWPPSSHTAMPVQHPQGLGPADGCSSVVLSTPANAPGKDCHAWEDRANFFRMAQLSKWQLWLLPGLRCEVWGMAVSNNCQKEQSWALRFPASVVGVEEFLLSLAGVGATVMRRDYAWVLLVFGV